MSKKVKVMLAMLFAATFLGLTADYFPGTTTGYALYLVLFVLAIYPTFRVAGDVSDRQFLIAAVLFVPLTVILRELQQFVPSAFVRYSAAALVALSIDTLIAEARKRRNVKR